jgi:hypothetical protein
MADGLIDIFPTSTPEPTERYAYPVLYSDRGADAIGQIFLPRQFTCSCWGFAMEKITKVAILATFL